MDADRWIWWKGQWCFAFFFRNLSRYLFAMIWSFVIFVECCRRVQMSWNYFAARLQSWILSFCFEGSELGIIGRLFSIPFPLVYSRTRPSKTSSCRWKCTSSSTRQEVLASGKPQQTKCYPLLISPSFESYLVQIGWFALHWQRLRNIRKDCTRLERIGKDWKGFLAFDLTAAPGKIV